MDGARKDRIVKAKNYSKLIEKGLFFSTAITYAPFTIAAMHAVFSGTYGTRTGVNSYWSNINFKKNLYKTLPRYMKDEGYITHADVINKLVLPPAGFDEFIIHDELNENLTERHLKLIDKFNSLRKNGENFFLYLHYSNIHTGIMEKVLKKYNNFSIEYFDHGIGAGEKFGERAYGVFCYDYTLVSTALFYNKKLPNLKIDQQVRSIDILPTILEILDISPDSNFMPIQGQSLIPLSQGMNEHRIAFSQSGNPLDSNKPPKEPNVYSVRTDEWKYIKNIYDDSEELYFLIDDPGENVNLIDTEKEKANQMRSEMNRILNS